ncbi:phage head closure protein [Liquorilactobacillus capillatus]|uniref:phage head closure protein n=1 Tax=Liquorilactobacillus capillatus TaxID=480931 RepID=UPI00070E09D1|nr:phage head closure protein [Liquorilactobacillus capillatus]
MPKKFLYSDFNQRIQFGTVKSVLNDNIGDYDIKFIADFKTWCKPSKRSRMQQYSLYGTSLNDSLDLIVRHDDRISTELKALYKGQVYDILVYNPNDGNNYMAYDYLTIKISKKKEGV